MSTAVTALAPLESGDRLTRDEFHRRYCAHPEIKRAELIAGVVYVTSPTRVTHGEPHGAVVGWIGVFASTHQGVRVADNATVFLGDDSEVQPDVCLFVEPAVEGQARVMDDDYIHGAPQLVIEIAASSAAYDLHDKMDIYRRNGVREYIVWQVYERRIDWFRLVAGAYVPVEPDARGVIASEAFPGLRLAVAKMLAGDNAGVLAELVATRSETAGE